MIKSDFIPKNPYDTFNKAILYSVHDYTQKSINDGLEPSPLHFRIKGAVSCMMNYNVGVNDKDIEAIKALAKEAELRTIVDVEVSYLVFTLELIKLWVLEVPKENRPTLNISDKKLKGGRANFAMGMLELKRRDAEKHAELTEIINDSVETANRFYEYHKKKLLDEDKIKEVA